jgi:hypothetical protein
MESKIAVALLIARNSETLWAELIIHDLYPVNQAIV